MPNISMVVPTCRSNEINSFLSYWGQERYWHQLIIVADAPQDDPRWRDADWGPVPTVYYSDSYERFYGPDSWIFSHRDSACKCFGFLKAVEGGADYIIVLDDDCLPVPEDRFDFNVGKFQADHLNALSPPAWCSTIPGMRLRGLPYGSWGVIGGTEDLLVHMGLWSNVPDLDAIQSLALSTPDRVLAHAQSLCGFEPPSGIRVMSEQQYWPFCGMHFSFKRRALPALYFPKMGLDSPYARFDDIWCGMLMQRVFREVGLFASVGEPFVEHSRASNVFANLRKEAPGIEAHENYWRVIESMEFSGEGLEECVQEAATQLQETRDSYLQQWGQALEVWLRLAGAALQESGGHDDMPVLPSELFTDTQQTQAPEPELEAPASPEAPDA